MPRFQGTPVEETPVAGARKPRFGGTPVEEPMRPATAAPSGAGPFDQHIDTASKKYGIPVPLLRAQIQTESSFNPNAVGPMTKYGQAKGLMQLMPGTAKELGVTDPFDPAQNIDAGARYLKQMVDRFGSLEKGLAAYNFGPGNVAKGKPLPKETRDYIAKIKKAVEGISHGMTRVPIGAAQIIQKVIPDDIRESAQGALESGVKALGGRGPTTEGDPLAEMEAAYQTRRAASGDTGFDWLDLAGNVASPWSWGIGAATRIPALAGGLWRTAGQAALTGGAEGALQPTYGKDFGTEKAVQAGTGAIIGPLFAGAGHAATNLMGKGLGLATGKMKPAAGEVMDLAKQHGVGVTVGDIGGGKAASRAEAVLERVPFVGIDRLKQQAQSKAAGGRLAGQLQKQMTDLSFQSLDKIKQVAASGGKRAAAANELLRQVADAGDDWQKIIQTSGNLRAFRMQLGADDLYDDVARLAGSREIPVTNVLEAVNKLDAELSTAKIRDPGTRGIVQQLMSTLDNPEMPNTYGSLQQLDSDLGALIRGSQAGGNEVIGTRAAGYLTEIKKALRKDMDAFAGSTPDLKSAFSRAQSFYRTKVAPYQSKDLAKALADQDADTIYRSFLGQGEHSATRFYRALDEKGRAAVRYGMVNNAMERATDAANGEFRPVLFAKAMNDVQKAQGVYFKGQQAAELQGFTKLMDHLQRASKTQTGSDFASNAILPAGAVSVAVDPTGTAAMGGMATFAMAKFLLTTGLGKRLIYSANLLKPGSSAMGKLAEEANRKFVEAGVEATTGGLAPRAAEIINQQMPVVGGAFGGRAGGDPDNQQQGRKLP